MSFGRTEREFVIIGGGVVGLCSALQLEKAGIRTVVVDHEGAPNAAASWGNAGHLAVEQVEPWASPSMRAGSWRHLTVFGGPVSLPPSQIGWWAPFVRQFYHSSSQTQFEKGRKVLKALLEGAIPAWRRMLIEYGSQSLLDESGHLVVWQDPEAARKGIDRWQSKDIGTAQFRVATAADRQDFERLTGVRCAGALVFKNTGQIRSLDGLRSLLNDAYKQCGGRRISASVAALQPATQGIRVSTRSGDSVLAEKVLIAAGVGSRDIFKSLGTTVPLIAERGYHVQAQSVDWPKELPPLVFEEKSIIVTRFNEGVRVAGFAEFGRPGASPNPKRWERLARHASELGFAMPPPMDRWVGARPTLPDYLPAIGRLSEFPNVFYAFGHQHLGLTLAPLTGELVRDLVLECDTSTLIQHTDLKRFALR